MLGERVQILFVTSSYLVPGDLDSTQSVWACMRAWMTHAPIDWEAQWQRECGGSKPKLLPMLPAPSVVAGEGVASADQRLVIIRRCHWQCQQWSVGIAGHPQTLPVVLAIGWWAATSHRHRWQCWWHFLVRGTLPCSRGAHTPACIPCALPLCACVCVHTHTYISHKYTHTFFFGEWSVILICHVLRI